LRNARTILRKASLVPYKNVDDLAAIWMGWAEMELRGKHYNEALAVLKEACTIPPAAKRTKEAMANGPVQARLHKHTKLWAFYADLQESLSGFDATKATYDTIIELRIVTPQIILNYASFLEEHKHFEDAFQAYEKGVNVFKYPHVLQIWLVYLTKFVQRFGGTKLERARDLFEQALEKCPAAEAHQLYLLYAKLEEEHGLMRNAMSIYQRAVENVSIEKRYDLYNIYIAKAAEFFGVTKTRDIYQAAVESLPNEYSTKMCLRYANLERKLGEVDRARAIYMFGGQDTDPSTHQDYWATWHDFEINHGNEDTFREMLRIKRAVQAQYVQAKVVPPRPGEKREREADDPMAAADAAQLAAGGARRSAATREEAGFIAAPTFQGARQGFIFTTAEFGTGYYRDGEAAEAAEPVEEEIDIDGGDEEEEIAQVEVPAAVFGAAGVEPVGALERFKRARNEA